MKICTKCKIEKPLSEFYKAKSHKDNLRSDCKECHNKIQKIYRLNVRKHKPWKFIFRDIKTRCTNHNCKDFKTYGNRGIKCLITEEELKELWYRDKAYLMNKPSIDRIDNDGNYEYSNCRYIEMNENSNKDKRKPVLQYDLNGNFIREWESIHKATKQLNLNNGKISLCCNNKRNQTGGFKWVYGKK